MAERNQTDTIFAGNRHVVEFTVTDEDNSTPLNLTGLVLKYTIARFDQASNPITSSPLVEKITGTGIVHTDAVNGVAEVTFEESDTIDFVPDDYYFELEVFDATPEGVVVATGTLTVHPNVTNEL